jgi:hypothetical protein
MVTSNAINLPYTFLNISIKTLLTPFTISLISPQTRINGIDIVFITAESMSSLLMTERLTYTFTNIEFIKSDKSDTYRGKRLHTIVTFYGHSFSL